MKKILLIVVLISSFMHYASATSYLGKVVVTSVRERPCFHVENADTYGKKFQLQFLEIGEATSFKELSENPLIWQLQVSRDAYSAIWPKSMCVQYGVLPQGFSENQPAPALVVRKMYFVNVTTTRDGGQDNSSIFHRARFCLIPDLSGTLIVQQVPWYEAQKRWRTEVCDAKP